MSYERLRTQGGRAPAGGSARRRRAPAPESFIGMVGRKNAELLGRSPKAGLLLRDLRQLYLMAGEAEIDW